MSLTAVVLHHLSRLSSPAWRVRAQAARMLAPAAARPDVWQALVSVARTDGNLAVRIQALRAAAGSGRPETLPFLEEALDRGPEPLQEHARSALAEWGVAAGREEEAARRLLEQTQCGDDAEGRRRKAIALYALGELDAPGVEEALDRFFAADEWPTAAGAWASLAYRKRRERLPELLQRVEEAPGEWVHDQALKTARLLADVQSRYYQTPFAPELDWIQGLEPAFPEALQPQARQDLQRLATAWRAGAYPAALATMDRLGSLLMTALGRLHGRWQADPSPQAPLPWLYENDPLAWARLALIRHLAGRPAFLAGRLRRWAQEELRAALAAFLELVRQTARLHRGWSGLDPAAAATDVGRWVWQLDTDQERAPYRLLVHLRRLGKEALPALRAFLGDPLVAHGHPWALELLGEMGEVEDLDALLSLATHPTFGETAQAAAARFGQAALSRVSPWLRRGEEASRLAAVGVMSRVPLPESWLALGEVLPQADGPLFQAVVTGLVRLGGRAALEMLADAGRSLDGERGLLARRAAVYLAGWEEEPELAREWKDVPLLGPLPEPATVGVHEFDVYTAPDHEEPPDPADRLPDPLPGMAEPT